MGERKKMQHYDKTFKEQAVAMVTEGGQKVSEVARSLGIHENLLYAWKAKYAKSGTKAFPGKGHLTELAALRKKLRMVEMERDILKKAVGIFSNPTENDSSL
jgi:transposase